MSNTKPHHIIDYIEFYVTNMQETKDFYSSLFNWEFTDYSPDYVGIKKPGGGEVGGFSLASNITPGGPLVVLYSNNIEESFLAVKNANTTITKEIFSFPGGRRFQFQDPSGNELAIWSDN